MAKKRPRDETPAQYVPQHEAAFRCLGTPVTPKDPPPEPPKLIPVTDEYELLWTLADEMAAKTGEPAVVAHHE